MLRMFLMIGCLCSSFGSLAKCEGKAFTQFDFWLGKWQVYTPDNKLAGHNEISKSHNGCVINERYTTPSGFSGESLNIYDATRGVWHQTWVDNSGLLLTLEGNVVDGAMVLAGIRKNKAGQQVHERITWTANKDGSVRQLWQNKTDQQAQWQMVFDGLYKPVKE
ncbi:hypothetical protein [Pseudoalteromonas caenipelagi]|uniref:hypothetical protein n=1 Tax=Pseudoalteromonas caenipelagi TaxID=2726988 RepID=UPI001FEA0769|nr:hypothetical protein [Pseudoalteromonas caenipelagi]